MISLQATQQQLAALFRHKGLFSNLSWMLLAEVAARLSRLVTVVCLGAYLTPVQYGTAMLAIVCNDLLRVFTRIGTGAKVIQCTSQQLPAFAGNAVTLQWAVCISLTVVQLFTAEMAANYYQNPQLVLPLQLMALCNLLYPLVTIRVFLLQRDNNMRYFAMATAITIIIENLGTALLVICGLGVMAVAYAKVAAALAWVVLFAWARVAHYPATFNRNCMRQLLGYSSKILTSELTKTLRLQIDTLFAAKILSPDLFGLYSFAKSAGVGLSQSLSNSYLSSLYPYLTQQQRHNALPASINKAYLIAAAISVIFMVQALLAPLYIELLFGQRWHDAASLMAILCLSAIPILFIDVTATIMRAKDQVSTEVMLSLYSLLVLATALMMLNTDIAQTLAMTVAISNMAVLITVMIFRGIKRGITRRDGGS
ncbi:oligosaccharide flippase family protein [Ferrimonas lipolytica]|uniref:Oligosaccharide flippase family protein n=1 Tax=Ferrimonas lipolytica TaxID=2724191 RepID=A0A6H1UDD0_9GAMM|nr:oligosaccharide flippase family protein [Ferrimonas lipolytica]QIZ76353.1 oligosaccharide flippase family protein [Ferrimonas lipolytica]